MGHERDLELLRNIIAGVSQLVMAVTPAINETAYDLNAAAFSETTAIANDFILDNVEINFSTTSIRDITITSSDGTILLEDTDNIDKNFVWSHIEQGFNGGENITVDITQTGAACLVDVKLRTRSGSNTLVGNPVVQGEDLVASGNYPIPLDRGGIAIPIIMSDHSRIHKGEAYSAAGKATGLNNGDSFDILLKNPVGNFPHFRVFEFDSDKSPGDILLYESPTTSADGDAVVINNLNRNSSNTPDLEVFTTPTVDAVGTQIEFHLVTGTKASGGSSQSATTEWILKVNTDYLIRFTAGANSTTVGWYIFFYEG